MEAGLALFFVLAKTICTRISNMSLRLNPKNVNFVC